MRNVFKADNRGSLSNLQVYITKVFYMFWGDSPSYSTGKFYLFYRLFYSAKSHYSLHSKSRTECYGFHEKLSSLKNKYINKI